MSRTTSPRTGRCYGIERVCRVWRLPRSTVYHRRRRPVPGRRGPKPDVPDERLAVLIRKDLAESPFSGEGYRKVHSRLRDDHVVGQNRVWRRMQAEQLLSPRRSRPRAPRPHDGVITTTAPDQVWATDGTKVLTVNDGWVWVFIAVDHFHAECIGAHVTTTGDRYAAMEPIGQGVLRHFGGVDRDIARGLVVHHDHGTQYTAIDFSRQLKYWGIAPSFAIVGEPQTNGVAERFIRTLKEQAIYGRVFYTTDDVRQAVQQFVIQYNQHWRLGKLGYRSPAQARAKWRAETMAA